VGIFLTVLFTAASSHAVTKCTAKVDGKTGVIEIGASGVGGTLLWGEAPGSEASVFANEATCVAKDRASKCLLGATTPTVTPAAITPPPLCTIYLNDGVAECAAFVQGCTPGVRSLPSSPFGSNTSLATTDTSGIGSGRECVLGEVWLSAGTLYPVNAVPAAGQLLPITTHAALYYVLSTTYGGDGVQTFALPDLRGAAPNGLTYVICIGSSIVP
jgi:hypothetical protein